MPLPIQTIRRPNSQPTVKPVIPRRHGAPSSFNHTTATTFPLTGTHIGLTCVSCHSKGYAGIATTCVSCHQNDYNSTNNPSHVTANYPTDCKTCHDVTVWTSATFNHNTTTTFPLTGAHTTVACASCHTTGYTGGTPDSLCKLSPGQFQCLYQSKPYGGQILNRL